jgi:hypothetical protein
MTFTKNFLLFFTILGFVGSAGLGLYAEVLISPKNSENQDAIVLSAKQGEEIIQEITLNNISNNDENVGLEVGDLVQLDGGAVTTIKPDEKRYGLAKFVNLDVKNLAIPPLTSVNIPLKISIPNDLETREYGIGLTVSLSQKLNEKSSIKNVITRGLKMYIFVEGGEKTLSADVENLKVNDNKMIEFQAKNTGPVFSKMAGNYTLNSKNSEKKQGTFQRDIISSESKKYFVSLPKDFNGEGELKVQYSLEPLTKNGEGVLKTEAKEISLSYSQNQGESNQGKQNVFQTIWSQIIGGILILSLLGFVLRKEMKLLLNLRKIYKKNPAFGKAGWIKSKP